MRSGVLAMVTVLATAGPIQAQQPCAEGADCGVMDRLGQLLDRLDPWFADLAGMLGDLSGWHAPEVLPNGDILIRRRQPGAAPAPEPADPAEEGEAPVTEPLEL